MSLTKSAIKMAKPNNTKPYMLKDDYGLYLEVQKGATPKPSPETNRAFIASFCRLSGTWKWTR
ncbi:MAG: hypothetical protein LBS53_10840 [Synergistaceae bacterium]|jgi:hypothetical protein|nr:hypothetical protein [Synergistaceae bacterium]